MSGRIKLFILLALVAVAAAYFVGGKEQGASAPAARSDATVETLQDDTAATGRAVLYGTIKNERVGLRRQPGGSVFAYLTRGQRVTMLSDNNQRAWIEVRAGALSGWVSLSDVTFDGE